MPLCPVCRSARSLSARTGRSADAPRRVPSPATRSAFSPVLLFSLSQKDCALRALFTGVKSLAGPAKPPICFFLAQQKPYEHAKKKQKQPRRESAPCRVSLSALLDLPTDVIVAFCFCGKGGNEDEWRGKGDGWRRAGRVQH